MEKITYLGRYRWEVDANGIYVYDETNGAYLGHVSSFCGARRLVRDYRRKTRP